MALLLPVLLAGLQAQSAHFSFGEATLGNGFSSPAGVAVDGTGNIYVGDWGHNAVKEILAAGGYTTVNTLGAGFNAPYGVALDGSGNVFVADTGNNAVKEIPPACVASSCVKTLASGFLDPQGVAVDGSGDVYVADTGNNAVKEILAPGGYATVITLGSGFSWPTGVAVNNSGDVFVTDTGNNAVKEIPPGCGVPSCIETLGSGFSSPTGVTLDGSGNVYVADWGNNAVKEILVAGGYTTVNTLGSFSEPQGEAVDGNGNVYVADSGKNRVVKLELASVDFGTVAIGQTSAAISLTFTFDTGGTIGSPVALTRGATGLDFAVANAGSFTAGTNYSAGATCTVNVTFTPKFSGTRYGATELNNSSGSTIAMGYVHGIGSGPQVNFPSGGPSTLGSGFLSPMGVAVDGSGNVYLADTYHSAVKEILAAGGYSTIHTLGGGFSIPYDVAVDGSGNVFVADQGHNAVKEIPPGCVTSSCVKSLGSGFSAPAAVAVDGSGNVYVADYGNNAVKEILALGGYTTVIEFSAEFSGPQGIAVDGSGNVFVGDSGGNAVKEIPAGSYFNMANTLGSGFNDPFGVAVDASGNVYVADEGNNAVKEILAAGGYTTVLTLAANFYNPFGLALDGNGNLYVANAQQIYSSAVKFDFADVPSVNFGSINFGANSAATVTVQNIGNAPLTLPNPAAGSNPSISQYVTLDNSAATACPVVTTSSAAASLASGAYCTLAIGLDPTVLGTISGSVVLTDNALNAASPSYATQTITLQGNVIQGAQTITFPNPGTQTYGTPLTLTATASSGLPVSYSLTSGPATLSGNTLTFTGTGPVTIMASQAGNADYSAATSVSQTFTVIPATLTVTANSAARLYGAENPTLTYTITGYVNGDTSAVVSGTASLTTTATVTSVVGTYPITFAAESLTAPTYYSFTYVSGTLVVYNTSLPLALWLSSNSSTPGSAGFMLTVNGANFAATSVVLWNGAVRATSYVSSTQLTAEILPEDIAQEGTNLVTVANLAPNPGTSSALPFAVMSNAPVAAISGGAISVAADGSGNHALTLTGTNFIPSSTVKWSGASLTTTYVSPWQISAVVTASNFTTQPVTVTVENPAGLSSALELNTISTPVVVAISPDAGSVQTGATQQFTATVTGSSKP